MKRSMSAKAAVHAHEKAKHPGEPLTPLAKGGVAKYNQGGVTNDMMLKMGAGMARTANQGPVGRKGKK